MSPEDRRAQIIEVARSLFATRPFSQVSTADVAEEAGVARSLVHHYFGNIRNLFLAVVSEGGSALADMRTLGPPAPIDERLAHNIPAGLDVVDANRETWTAVMGHRHSSGDPEVDALSVAVEDYNVERSLTNNGDVLDDTPLTRAAMRALLALARETTRVYVAGEISRAEAEAFLITAWKQVILEAVPAAQRAGEPKTEEARESSPAAEPGRANGESRPN